MAPMYEFRDEESGAEAEIYFPMAEAPEIGSTIELDGRKLVRVINPDHYQSQAKRDLFIPGAPSLPRARWDGHKFLPPQEEPWHPPSQTYDAKGRPVFESLKKKDEFIARSEGTYAYGID